MSKFLMNDVISGDSLEMDWVPLLQPDMPSPKDLFPFLEQMQYSRTYTNFGPLVKELEREFSNQFGLDSDFITTVASATSGLELVLMALALPEKSKILVPAFTFVATATAVLRAGYQPVLADVDEDTWLLTPSIARAALLKKDIAAIIPVATFGMPHCLKEWQALEDETGIPVVIDAAAAYGSQWLHGGKGTLVFSLHATKSLPAGEGGLVVSTKPGLANAVRQLSNFGINLTKNNSVPVGVLGSVGTNAKMSEYHAAVALAALKTWDFQARRRRWLQDHFVGKINQSSDQVVFFQKSGKGGGLMAPTVLCLKLFDVRKRRVFESICNEARITTRRWYLPLLSNMKLIREKALVLEIENSLVLSNSLIGLPFFPGMSKEHVLRVEDILSKLNTI